MSERSLSKEITDQALHVLLALAGLLPVAARPKSWWAFVLAAFWFAFWREDAQHRPDEGWYWIVGGKGGRWRDIIFGTLGGLPAWALARFVFS